MTPPVVTRSGRRRLRAGTVVLSATLLCGATAGCTVASSAAADGRLRVVATTPVIADLARQVAGPDADVDPLVPLGADPHTFEPSLRGSRTIAYADLALTNHLLLEQERILRTVRSTLPPGSALVELSEESGRHGIELLPVVENQLLDQLWLGARVEGDPGDDVTLRLEDASGPGEAHGFLTGTFGSVEQVFDSTGPGRGGLVLQADSHTHLSWGFTAPGVYHLTFTGHAADEPVTDPAELVVAVGVDPATVPELSGRTVVSDGHGDITVDVAQRRVVVQAETDGSRAARRALPAEDLVLQVEPRAVTEVPPARSYRFLGRPGEEVYLLPQAVLGKHVHGRVDPHVWLSVPNARAWAERIRDVFVAEDPVHADGYRERTDDLLVALDALDADVRAEIAAIPPSRRQIVTTQDAFAYLAREYGLKVAGFAVPATGAQTGPHQQARLAAAVRHLGVPAVFVQPGELGASEMLRRVAGEAGAQVCTLRADVLDSTVTTYEQLIRGNAAELRRCLG